MKVRDAIWEFFRLMRERRLGLVFACVLGLALGSAFLARGQESDLPFLLGEWHFTGEGTSYTVDVRRNGDVWRTNGPMARVANTTERGGNFAFETGDFRCVYYITFLRDPNRSRWEARGPKNRNCPSGVCAVTRRRFPVGASPARRPLQPEAAGAAKEVTNWLKPSECVSRIGDSASVQAVTRGHKRRWPLRGIGPIVGIAIENLGLVGDLDTVFINPERRRP